MAVTPSGTLQGPPDEHQDPFEPLLERPVSRRFLLFKGGVVVAFGALAVRLWQMQIAEGRQYAAQAEQNRVDALPIKAPRGVIYDRNGIVLAGNKANWNVTIVPAILPRSEPERRAVFGELNRLLATPWVLALLPRRLPVNAEADVFDHVAQALGRPADQIAALVAEAVRRGQTPVLVDDLTPEAAQQLRLELAGLPGLMLVSRPEFLVSDSPTDPRLPVVVQRGVPRDLALRIESHSLFMPGVGIQPEPGRAYPSGSIAAHVVGYVGRVDPETRARHVDAGGQSLYAVDDDIGQAGMEAVLEPVLRGRRGFHVVEVDIHRRIVREISSQPPTPGASVALTIDLGLQKAATDALNEQMARAGAVAGAAVALDPATGEVLALVSLPAFDSQAFADGLSVRAYDALLNDANRPLFNRGLGGRYAPGACLMPFVGLAALRHGVVDGATIHVCTGSLHIPADYNEITRRVYRCWQPAGHGPLTLPGALSLSCDLFFYHLALPAMPDARGKNLRYYEVPVGGTPIEFKGLGIDRINSFLGTLGFGRPTGLELPGEGDGLLPSPDWKMKVGRGDWDIGDTINSSLGLGDLQVTPLQMAVATAAIANGGTLYHPRLLKSILRDGHRAIEEQRPVKLGAIDAAPDQIELVRHGLKVAVLQGTAAGRVVVPDVVVAGKTGTPEGEPPGGASPPPAKPHAWFIAFAPYEQPRIAVAVVVEKAGAGAVYAAPVVERMLRQFFRPR